MTEKPLESDFVKARAILDHIRRLRELADYAGSDSTQAEENFIALLLRNERAAINPQNNLMPNPALPRTINLTRTPQDGDSVEGDLTGET